MDRGCFKKGCEAWNDCVEAAAQLQFHATPVFAECGRDAFLQHPQLRGSFTSDDSGLEYIRWLKLYLLLHGQTSKGRVLGFREAFWLHRSAVEIDLGREMDASTLLVSLVVYVIDSDWNKGCYNSDTKADTCISDITGFRRGGSARSCDKRCATRVGGHRPTLRFGARCGRRSSGTFCLCIRHGRRLVHTWRRGLGRAHGER